MTEFDAAWYIMGAYHSTFPKEGIGMRLVRDGSFARAFPQGIRDTRPSIPDIVTLLDNPQSLPPNQTVLRSAGVRALKGAGLDLNIEFDWEIIDVRTWKNNRRIGKVVMNDPYATQSEELDTLIELARAA